MTFKDDAYYFYRAIELSKCALEDGNDGFASVLVDQNGDIVFEQTNKAKSENDLIAHDAISLVRAVSKIFTKEDLQQCTLYATMEPCVMCMGAIYWANIGNVRFAVSEKEYSELRGGGGLDISSMEFARRSPRKITVIGPFPEVHDEVIKVIRTSLSKHSKLN